MERKVFIGMGIVLIILILYTHNFTIRVSRHEMEALSDQQRALLNKSRSIQHKRENLQRAIIAFRAAIQELQSQVQNLNREIQSMQKDIQALEGGLEQSDRAVSQIRTTPIWNLYSMDMTIVLVVLLFILWILYRLYMDHRRLTASTTDKKIELKVLEGQKTQSPVASAGMGQRKKS